MKKICIIGILILLTLIPISSAIDISNNVDKESYEDPEIEPIDNYNEIYTFIEGDGISAKFTGIGLIRHAEINGFMHLRGYRYPTVDNPKFSFHELSTHVIAPVFIGFERQIGVDHYLLYGIALGNIEWS